MERENEQDLIAKYRCVSGEHLPAVFIKTEENVVWEEEMNNIIINQIADYGCVSGEHLPAGFMKAEENVAEKEDMKNIIFTNYDTGVCVRALTDWIHANRS